MAIIQYNEISSLRNRHPKEKIVFCSGSFDLAHAGHVLFFEDCKNLGDILIVAVGNDKDIYTNKGLGRPILNEHMRLKMIDSLKPVDYAFLGKSPRPGTSWLSFAEDIFSNFKPDIWVVNEDVKEVDNHKVIADKHGVSFLVLKRNAPPEYGEISTTSIIKKIKGS